MRPKQAKQADLNRQTNSTADTTKQTQPPEVNPNKNPNPDNRNKDYRRQQILNRYGHPEKLDRNLIAQPRPSSELGPNQAQLLHPEPR